MITTCTKPIKSDYYLVIDSDQSINMI